MGGKCGDSIPPDPVSHAQSSQVVGLGTEPLCDCWVSPASYNRQGSLLEAVARSLELATGVEERICDVLVVDEPDDDGAGDVAHRHVLLDREDIARQSHDAGRLAQELIVGFRDKGVPCVNLHSVGQ